jgi:dTDP-4-amino-4,6-dideoxygalactose transaminase
VRYHEELADWGLPKSVSQPFVPDGCEYPARLYRLLVTDCT